MPQNNCIHILTLPNGDKKEFPNRNAFMDEVLSMDPETLYSYLKPKENAIQIKSATGEMLRPEVSGESKGMGLQEVGQGNAQSQESSTLHTQEKEITSPEDLIGNPAAIEHNGVHMAGRISDVHPDGSLEVKLSIPDGTSSFVKVQPDKIKDISDKVKDYLKSLKYDTTGKMFDATMGLPISIWNGSLDIIINAIDAGMTMAEAVRKAINYIDEHWGKEFNREGYLNMIIQSAKDDNIDYNEDELKSILLSNKPDTNEPYFDVSEKQKEPLSEEQVNDIKDKIQKRVKDIINNEKEKKKYRIGIEKIKNYASEMKDSFLNVFTAIRSEDARKVATIFNSKMGEFNIDMLKHYNKIEEAKKELTTLSRADRLEFISYIQNGVTQKNESLQKHADLLSSVFDDAANELSKIKDLNILDNYFPQFWDNQKSYNKVQGRFSNKFNEVYSRMKIEGPVSFYKRRILSDILSGYENRFSLVTENPAELAQLYLHSASQFRMGYNFLNALVDANMAIPTVDGETNIKNGQPIPSYFVKGDYGLFNSFAKKFYKEKITSDEDGEPQSISPSEGIYVDPHVNHLLSTIYGPTVSGDIKKTLRRFGNLGNALNFMQLGLSLFHGTTTIGNFMASNVGLAMTNLSAGKPVSAAKFFSKGLFSPVFILKAFKMFSDMKEAAYNGDYNPSLQLVQDAGGRIMADPIYTLRMKDKLRQTYYDLKNNDLNKFYGIPKLMWQSLLTMQTATTEAIMTHFVPAIKLMAFNQLAMNELELRRPSSEMERLQITQQAWTHVDNRFGLMVYDRLFMNKTLKEGSFLGFRAFGWTIGNIKELGGGASTGLVKSAQRLSKGQGLSPETAFTLGLIGSNAIICGAVNYLLYGHNRDMNYRDFLAIDTGKKNKDGTPVYLSPLAYMREINSYTHDIWTLASKGDFSDAEKQFASNASKTFSNKVNPAFTFLSQLWNNEDYYGNPIFHHPNKLLSDDQKKSYVNRIMNSKLGDAIKYAADEFTPISFKSDIGKEESMNTIAYWEDQIKGPNILTKLGVTPSAKTFDRETWQNIVMDKYISTIDKGKPFDKNLLYARNEIQMGIQNEKSEDDKAAVMALINHLREQGIIKPNQGYLYFKRLNKDYYSNLFSHLDPETQIKIIALNVIPEQNLKEFMVHGIYHKSYDVKQAIVLWARKNKDLVNSSDMYKNVIEQLDPYWK